MHMITKNEPSKKKRFWQVGVCLAGWALAATLGAIAWTHIAKQHAHIEEMKFIVQHKQATVDEWEAQQQRHRETEAGGVQ
jgi:hypothetical protein